MRFAHMADLHLGAISDPRLRRMEMEALSKSFDMCADECVDFIIISGDIFHVNVPDLGVVRDAVSVFRRFTDTGRKIYVVYGSHDFSPNYTSVIDILEAAGLFVRVGKPTVVEGRVRPSVAVDRSGALLTGVSGRRASLEREALASIDREYLGSLEGFKIFVFHTGIDEVREKGERFEGVASTDLPQGFDYYAGGHIHRTINNLEDGKRIVYPGPLFTGWGSDLEATVRGMRRGFFMVECDDDGGRVEPKFKETIDFPGVYQERCVDGMAADAVNTELRRMVDSIDVEGKVIVLKVFGELASGRVCDIDFASLRNSIMERGALYLHLCRNQLRTREASRVTVGGGAPSEIEERVLKELWGTVKVDEPRLRENSIAIAKALLQQLRVQKMDGETETDYRARMTEAAKAALGLKGLME